MALYIFKHSSWSFCLFLRISPFSLLLGSEIGKLVWKGKGNSGCIFSFQANVLSFWLSGKPPPPHTQTHTQHSQSLQPRRIGQALHSFIQIHVSSTMEAWDCHASSWERLCISLSVCEGAEISLTRLERPIAICLTTTLQYGSSHVKITHTLVSLTHTSPHWEQHNLYCIITVMDGQISSVKRGIMITKIWSYLINNKEHVGICGKWWL